MKSIEEKVKKKLLFIDVSLNKQYNTNFNYHKKIELGYKDDSICVDLKSGNLMHMIKHDWINYQHRVSLININSNVNSVYIKRINGSKV